MKRKQKFIDDYVIETLTNSGLKGDHLTKLLIIWKTFFNQVKPSLVCMTKPQLIHFADKFLLFIIEFETICVRAHRPSGSGNSAADIISMYSAKGMHEEPLDSPEEIYPK